MSKSLDSCRIKEPWEASAMFYFVTNCEYIVNSFTVSWYYCIAGIVTVLSICFQVLIAAAGHHKKQCLKID
jgi:hypothetical protein